MKIQRIITSIAKNKQMVQMYQRRLDLAEAKLKLSKIPPLQVIINVCDELNWNVQKITSNSRERKYLIRRQILMYLFIKTGAYSSKMIGKAFGRDHSTVLHSKDVVIGALEVCDEFYTAEFFEIETTFNYILNQTP
jgi:chromosomal replication initiation ATPase DnaA